LVPQAGLVGFDDQKIVRVALLDQIAGGVALGVQRIGGDQRPGQRHRLQEQRQQRDLIGFLRYGDLRHDGFLRAAEGAEQVQPLRAFEGLAVDAEQREFRAVGEQPLADQLIELVGGDGTQDPLEGALAGRLPPLRLGI
jgi:hypothetical protein